MITQLINNLLTSLNENGTAYAICVALSAFLGKIWAGRIARREDKAIRQDITRLEAALAQAQAKLQGKVDATVHIHKAQFEKEFEVYQQIMRDVNRVRSAIRTLHPTLKEVFASEAESDKHYNPLREEFAAAFKCVRATIDDNKPFYAVEISKPCEAFADLCADEIRNLNCAKGEGVLDWKAQEKMKIQFSELITQITDGIRHRLDSVTVIE